MAAFNPNGAEAPGTPNRAEGYLYWEGWLGHLGNSIFSAGDAHGLYRRIYLTASCANFNDLLDESPLPSRPIFENISGFGALFAPGGPCA